MADWKARAARINRTAAGPFSRGTSITYTPAGGSPVGMTTGVFDEASEYVDLSEEPPVISRQPILSGAPLAELGQEPEEGDAFAINGVDYLVRTAEADAPGVSFKILLRRVAVP